MTKLYLKWKQKYNHANLAGNLFDPIAFQSGFILPNMHVFYKENKIQREESISRGRLRLVRILFEKENSAA